MKIAVYNRYWQTLGGGERYTGSVAQALAAKHDVTLLTNDPLDLELISERLDLDLSGVRVQQITDAGRLALKRATESFDLFVNCSHLSEDANGARRGIKMVQFPTAHLTFLQHLNIRLLGRFVRSRQARLEWGVGFYPPEGNLLRAYRWTSSERVVLRVFAPLDEETELSLLIGSRPKDAGSDSIKVEVDGVNLAMVPWSFTGGTRVRVSVRGLGLDSPVEVILRSDTFVPAEIGLGNDIRRLGFPLLSVRVGKRITGNPRFKDLASFAAPRPVEAIDGALGTVGLRLGWQYPYLREPKPNLGDHLDTYDRVVSISEFTRKWVKIRWDRDSDILYPAVPQIPGRAKENIILSVGRFFDRKHGHSKKQLDMVRAFRSMIERGLGGWELHLCGGVSPEQVEYLDRVREEAEGLPIRIHVDVSGEVLKDLYSRAAIYWHATGLGEKESKDPHLFEHFGITTVEAMSAGAVPVVIGKAGQIEIVTDGVDGFHFQNLGELVGKTMRLIQDEALRRSLSQAAIHRAKDFAIERFSERLEEIVQQVVG